MSGYQLAVLVGVLVLHASFVAPEREDRMWLTWIGTAILLTTAVARIAEAA